MSASQMYGSIGTPTPSQKSILWERNPIQSIPWEAPPTHHLRYESGSSSCPSPLLFITILEALSQEFRSGCLWEYLYTDDPIIISESLEKLPEKLILWKSSTEGKGARFNMGKIKILISRPGPDML